MIRKILRNMFSPQVQKSFLLMIGDEATLLIPPRRGTGGLDPVFAPHRDDQAQEKILAVLQEHNKTPILILADNLGLEIRHETLPPLSFSDRRKLIKRRLQGAFPKTKSNPPLQDFLYLNEESALLLCLHREGSVAFWETRLKEENLNLQGSLLLPLESAEIIRKICPDTEKGWGLLLSFERTGGFRQIITKDGNPILTRLTPTLPLGASSAYIAGTIAVDIGATKDYLARFGLIDGAPLHLIAILPKKLHRAFSSMSADVTQLTLLTPHETAKKIGLTYGPVAEDPASDLLFAAWIQHKIFPKKRLRETQEKIDQKNKDIRQIGLMITSILWFILFLPVLIGLPSLLQTWQETHRIETTISILQDKLMEEESNLAPLTEPLGLLRQAIAHERIFKEKSPTPFDDTRLLAKLIQEENQSLSSITWQEGKNETISKTTFTIAKRESVSPDNLDQTLTDKTPSFIKIYKNGDSYIWTRSKP